MTREALDALRRYIKAEQEATREAMRLAANEDACSYGQEERDAEQAWAEFVALAVEPEEDGR